MIRLEITTRHADDVTHQCDRRSIADGLGWPEIAVVLAMSVIGFGVTLAISIIQGLPQ